MSDDKRRDGAQTDRTATRSADEARRQKAIKDLEGAAAGSEVFGTSSFVKQAERARSHFSGEDADPDDRIEVWGRRIGRGLSLIAFFALLIYLSVTYF